MINMAGVGCLALNLDDPELTDLLQLCRINRLMATNRSRHIHHSRALILEDRQGVVRKAVTVTAGLEDRIPAQTNW